MDELGRGTSTFDGISIAYSSLKYLLNEIKARLFFSTHYHLICTDFSLHPSLQFAHMGCVIQPPHSIHHTYTLTPGPSSNSFGINVAQLAGIPPHILTMAKDMSARFKERLQIERVEQTNQEYNQIVSSLF